MSRHRWGGKLGAVTSGQDAEYPNCEELPFAVRSFVGALPVLWTVIVLAVLAAWLWTANIGTPLISIAWVLLSIAIAALVLVGARAIPKRTPTSIRVESSCLLAIWRGSDEERESIPFERITSVEPRQWRWPSGKGGYAHFIPSAVRLESQTLGAEVDLGDGQDAGVVYLTDENATRVHSSLLRWSVSNPVDAQEALPSTSDTARSRWRPHPAEWSECMRCGRPLNGEAERQLGVCSGCRVLAP
jgi:hypothetical protein